MERELSPAVMRCHYPHLCCSCLCPSTYLYCLPRFLARFFPCPCAVHPHSFNPSMRRCLITFVAHNLTLSRRLSPPSLLPSSLSSCYLFNPSYTAFPPSYTLSLFLFASPCSSPVLPCIPSLPPPLQIRFAAPRARVPEPSGRKPPRHSRHNPGEHGITRGNGYRRSRPKVPHYGR